MTPEAAYAAAASVALCVTDRTVVQPRPQPKPAHGLWSASIQPYVVLVCHLNGVYSVIHVNTWMTTHLPTPEG